MDRDHQHNPDPNVNAARIVRQATDDAERLPPDVESAWAEWASHIQNVDERGLSLLRAAFEAGWEAGRSTTA